MEEFKNITLWVTVSAIFNFIMLTILFVLVVGLINQPQIVEKNLINSCQTTGYFYLNEKTQLKCELVKKD